MQDRIINLVGPSGTGKTTIAKELEKEGFNIIYSFTTRKPRYEGEWGHTFTDIDGWEFRSVDDVIIAEKELYDHGYWATKEQYQGKGTSIYIVDPDGAEQVKRNVDDAEVVTIFLNADESCRDARMRDVRTFDDRMDRLMKDREVFKVVKCDYSVDANREVEEVLKDVIGIIEND